MKIQHYCLEQKNVLLVHNNCCFLTLTHQRHKTYIPYEKYLSQARQAQLFPVYLFHSLSPPMQALGENRLLLPRPPLSFTFHWSSNSNQHTLPTLRWVPT